MTIALPMELMTASAQPPDVPAALDQLRERARVAEDRAAGLELALAGNRRIGIAVGILMCRCQLTEDEAFAELSWHSQHRNVKVRELAETVIYTGSL